MNGGRASWLTWGVERWPERVSTIRVIGTGVMGRGIVQLAASAGLTVELADAQPDAVARAVEYVGGMFGKLPAKGRMTSEDARLATERLPPADEPVRARAGL